MNDPFKNEMKYLALLLVIFMSTPLELLVPIYLNSDQLKKNDNIIAIIRVFVLTGAPLKVSHPIKKF